MEGGITFDLCLRVHNHLTVPTNSHRPVLFCKWHDRETPLKVLKVLHDTGDAQGFLQTIQFFLHRRSQSVGDCSKAEECSWASALFLKPAPGQADVY